ncbi:hypothetical protein ACVIM8_001846 [Bradyrhizobium sp. USDA 4529]
MCIVPNPAGLAGSSAYKEMVRHIRPSDVNPMINLIVGMGGYVVLANISGMLHAMAAACESLGFLSSRCSLPIIW